MHGDARESPPVRPPADPPVDAARWAAFGYQNHVVPVHDPRRRDRELIGVCGVLTSPEAVSPRDGRPTCSVCAAAVRDGDYRIIDAGH